MPKICIIIPVYNAEKYIGDCIDSIINQSYKDFNLVLINDGSVDGSLSICEQYSKQDQRIIVFSQENKGASSARNLGLDWAMSQENFEYIAFVDSDDWVHPDYLLLLYEGVKKHGCKISMCNALRSDTRDLQFIPCDSQTEIITPEKMWCRDRNLCVVPWGKIYAAELFESIRFPEEVRFGEDEFVSYQVLFACETICLINAQLYIYFQSENSIMRSEWSPKRLAGIEALEQQLDFFYKNGYRDALHESANTYLYLLNDFIKCIESKEVDSIYKKYVYDLKRKLRDGVRVYFSEYCFPKKGNEWVYALTHPVTGKILLKLK